MKTKVKGIREILDNIAIVGQERAKDKITYGVLLSRLDQSLSLIKEHLHSIVPEKKEYTDTPIGGKTAYQLRVDNEIDIWNNCIDRIHEAIDEEL